MKPMLIAVPLILMLTPPGHAGPPTLQTFTTPHHQQFAGKAKKTGKLTIIDDGLRHIYLTPQLIKTQQDAGDVEPIPIFNWDENIKAVKETKKEGKVQLVVDKIRWGALKIFSKTPSQSFQCVDPNLGDINIDLRITSISPTTYTLEGANYNYQLQFPTRNLGRAADQLVAGLIDRDNKDSLLKAARFYRHLGNFTQAHSYLKLAQAKSPVDDVVKKEFQRLSDHHFRNLTQTLRHLLKTNQILQAHALAQQVKFQGDQREQYPELDALCQTIQTRKSQYDAAQDHWKTKRHQLTKLSALQAQRVHRHLKLDTGVPVEIPKNSINLLKEKWLDVPDLKLEADVLQSASTLADATANFFQQESLEGQEELAKKFADAKLPLALKLSIFKYARKYDAVPEYKRWTRVNFKYPGSAQEFYYYIQLPPGYNPNEPATVLLSLHGQNSTAEVMNQFWGGTCMENNIVLISPEYVYGRKMGYQFSGEEHRAVFGALGHATQKVNIDTDRVFLQGHSQGGHASWDMASAQAGRLAGAIPIIGCSMMPQTHDNFLDTALYVVDGSEDGGAPAIIRKSMKILAKLDTPSIYVEYTGRKHEAFKEEYPAIARWMPYQTRHSTRPTVNLIALRPVDVQRNWVEIRKTQKPLAERYSPKLPSAEVTGTFKKNKFTLRTKNVETVRVYLPPEMVDFSNPVTFYLNGRLKHRARFEPDWKFALESSYYRKDRQEIFLGFHDLDR